MAKRNIRFVVMNADGTGEVTLPEDPSVLLPREPRWSPGGNTIVYVAVKKTTNTTGIYTMNAGGGDIKLIADGPLIQGPINFQGRSNPDFSPDGNRIVCTAFGRSGSGGMDSIVVMGADGSNESIIAEARVARYPRWSPDGSKIVCQTDNGTGPLLVMNADGSGQRSLNEASSSGRPAWSPDSAQIVFSMAEARTPVLYTVRPDGSNLTRLVSDGSAPSW